MPEFTETDIPPAAETAAQAVPLCRLSLTEEFVKSEDLNKLVSIFTSCRGEMPVEIAVQTLRGRRCWRVDSTINPQAVRMLRLLDGVTVEE